MRTQLEDVGAAIGAAHRARAELREGLDEYGTLTTQLSQKHSEKSALSREMCTLLGKTRELRKEVSSVQEDARVSTLEEADVVCTTLAGSGVQFLQKVKGGFDTVVIDEAAQAVELASLIPLRLGCTKCVLVGDPKQLPATVISQRAKKFGYDRSLFERMQRCGYPVQMLDVQYRMHSQICDFPSQHFYGSRLRTGPAVDQREHEYYQTDLLQPLRFVDTLGGCPEQKGANNAISNPGEARTVATLVQRIRNACAAGIEEKIGVITPYRGQVSHPMHSVADAWGG